MEISKSKKWTLGVCAIVVLSWVLFNFSIQRFLSGPGQLVFPMKIRSLMKTIAESHLSYGEVQEKLVEWQPHWEDPNSDNRYIIQLNKEDMGEWELTARPENSEMYRYPLWKRLLFVNFHKDKIPAFRTSSKTSDVERF